MDDRYTITVGKLSVTLREIQLFKRRGLFICLEEYEDHVKRLRKTAFGHSNSNKTSKYV